MVTWYRTRTYSNTIDEIEVSRETEQSVFTTNGSGRETQHAKISQFGRYFSTRADAVACLTNRIESRIDMLTRELENLKATLAKGL
jgi:uncharacterized small protein (DUF1192 family)